MRQRLRRSCTVSEASSIIKQQQRNNLAGSLKAVRSLTVPQPWAYALDPGKKGSGFTDLHAQGFVHFRARREGRCEMRRLGPWTH